MGEGGFRLSPRQDAELGLANSFAGRRDLRRSAVRQGRQRGRRPVSPAAIARSIWRHGRDGSVDRPRGGDGGRLLVRPEPVQSRDPGLSTAGIDVQIEIDQGQGAGVWRPENFSVGSYRGPITLREALKWSINTVTVRLAQDVGMPLIGEYAKRFGVYEELPNYLSYSLGAGETTVMRMVTAYSMFANGGRRVKPTLIDRIQDRYGRTIFKHDGRECRGCDAPGGWKNQPEPQLV